MLGTLNGASQIDHCEQNYLMTSSIAEPLGCAGSAFAVLAGLWLTHIGKKYVVGNEFEACFISVILSGISGIMFHAGLTLFYQRLYEGTELFMIIYIGMKLSAPRKLLVPTLVGGMAAFLYLISETSFDHVHFTSNSLFLTFVLYRCMTLAPYETTLNTVLWRSAVIYGLAMIVQHVDRNMCDSVKEIPIPGFWATLTFCWHAMQTYCYLSTVMCALYERLKAVPSQMKTYKLVDEEIPYLVENISTDHGDHFIEEPVKPVDPPKPLPKPPVIPPMEPATPLVFPPVEPAQPPVMPEVLPQPLPKPPVIPPMEPAPPLVFPPVQPVVKPPVPVLPKPQSDKDWDFESPSKPVQPKQQVFSGEVEHGVLTPPSPEEFPLGFQMQPARVKPERMSVEFQPAPVKPERMSLDFQPAPVKPERMSQDFQVMPTPMEPEPMMQIAGVKPAGNWDFGSPSSPVGLMEAESRPSNGSWTRTDFSAAPQALVGRDEETSFTEQWKISPTLQWKRTIHEVGSEAQQPRTRMPRVSGSGAYQGRYSLGRRAVHDNYEFAVQTAQALRLQLSEEAFRAAGTLSQDEVKELLHSMLPGGVAEKVQDRNEFVILHCS